MQESRYLKNILKLFVARGALIEEWREGIGKGVPISLYRYLFTKEGGREFFMEDSLDDSEKRVIEKLLLNSSPKGTQLVSRISLQQLERFFGINYKEKMRQLQRKQFKAQVEGIEIFASLMSQCLFVEEGCEVALSREMQILCLVDYKVPERTVQRIEKMNEEISSLLRYLLSFAKPPENGILWSTLEKRVGQHWTPLARGELEWELQNMQREGDPFGIALSEDRRLIQFTANYPGVLQPKHYAKDLISKKRRSLAAEKQRQSKNQTPVLDEKMREIARKNNIEDIEKTFALFSNHYSARKMRVDDWSPLWVNWCIRANDFSGSSLKEQRHLQNRFYLLDMVSELIKDMLRQKEISVDEVLSGEQEIEEVGVLDAALPPGMGRGSKKLLFWRDQERQSRAIESIGGKECIVA